jgi:hypothetical protein
VPGEFSNPDNFGLNWTITSYEKNLMVLQLTFENPFSVSILSVRERLKIIFFGNQLIVSFSGIPIEQESVIVSEPIPP